MRITKASWAAVDVYSNPLASNTLAVNVEVQNVENPRDMLAPGTALYNQLMADAQSNPAVAGYINPIPPAIPGNGLNVADIVPALFPAEIMGYTIPQVFLYVTELDPTSGGTE